MIVNLNPGDRIEYTRKLDRNRAKDCKGVVIQVTNKHITVDLGKYNDSFQLCDIGKDITITFPENAITIPPKEDEDLRTKQITLPEVTTGELRQIWADCQYKVSRVASHFKVAWRYAEELLKKHNLLDEVPQCEGYPVMVKGRIDWDVMWPLCKAELDAGKSKEDVAGMFNISFSTLDARIKRIKRWERTADKLNVPKLEPKAEPVPENFAAHLCDHTHERVNAKVEVTEEPQEPLGLDIFKIEPERLKSRKMCLLDEAQKIDDMLELLDLCLYWYDRGRQDGVKEE